MAVAVNAVESNSLRNTLRSGRRSWWQRLIHTKGKSAAGADSHERRVTGSPPGCQSAGSRKLHFCSESRPPRIPASWKSSNQAVYCAGIGSGPASSTIKRTSQALQIENAYSNIWPFTEWAWDFSYGLKMESRPYSKLGIVPRGGHEYSTKFVLPC